jgi:WhiB family redox-sensing transcriptional regulator
VSALQIVAARRWKLNAACAESDPDTWFPTTDGDSPLTEVEDHGRAITAKRVCMTCLVRNECLQEALDRKEQHGIWGGLTTKERNRLLRGKR